MRRAGVVTVYVVAAAIAFGGVGDLTVHALGGGLVGIGVASFALVHFAVRRGERWALGTMLAAVVAAEGANAVGMYAVGSFWYVSATFVLLTAIGVALVVAGKSKT